MAPILVADDNEAEAYLVTQALREAGVQNEVHLVRDGESAIAFLERSRPCLVLLDQLLPGCSGLEVLDWLRRRSRTPTVPALLLSASNAEADVRAAYLVGANGYLVKPTSHEETVAMARAVKDYWLTFNRSPSL